MALFMAEEGIECLTKRKEAILSCVNKTVPELFKTVNNKLQSTYPGAMRRSVDPVIVFNQENCRRGDHLRNCVEQELLKCEDPTPSNVINAMFIAMWNSTPCRKIIGPPSGYKGGVKNSKWNKATFNSSSRHHFTSSYFLWTYFLVTLVSYILIRIPRIGSLLISRSQWSDLCWKWAS